MDIGSIANEETIHDRRSLSRMGLQTYRTFSDSAYDHAIDDLIDQKRSRIATLNEEHQSWENLKKNDPEKYKEHEENAERYEIDLQEHIIDGYIEISDHEQQLLALVEMKVIYAFKTLEVSLKTLLTASFKSESTKQLFKWEVLSSFLKENNIRINLLDGYKEVNELRKINNALKHSDSIVEEIKNIEEFKNLKILDYQSLSKFYERVQPFSSVFIDSLKLKIEEELYEFDHLKIKFIAQSLALRMGKQDVDKLIDELREIYDQKFSLQDQNSQLSQ